MRVVFSSLLLFCWFAVSASAQVATTSPQEASQPAGGVPGDHGTFAFVDDISEQAYPDTGYDQPLSPQFHFVSKRNWINDPNGMVHDGSRFHLFFQHNPKATVWGNMTWGHATSDDMVHWTQHDHALLPYRVDGRKGTIFSGTAVIDHRNDLGKQVGDQKTICAFYTFANDPEFYQAMAYSTDGGWTWTYWNDGRAVVDNQGFDSGERDPKVFWHEPSRKWVMILWVQRNPGRVRVFTSENLTEWSFASDLMKDWAYECMDYIELPLDENPQNIKSVIYDASFDYEVGSFDGKTFTAETPTLKAGGGHFYAAQTFNQMPDERVVQIGWMRGGPNASQAYGVPHNGQMSFPCRLSLRTTDDGPRLFAWPIEEIESLVTNTHHRSDVTIVEGENALADLGELDLVDLEMSLEPGTADSVALAIAGARIRYDTKAQTLSINRAEKDGSIKLVTILKDLKPRDGVVKLRFLVDRLSVETYAFDGQRFRADYIRPANDRHAARLTVQGGQAKLNELIIRELKSVWK